ncbi:MAG: HAD family hydrolase [Opitutus sp.]|nr:HAD family hydrolase [Opitutus sp.]
MSRAAQPKAVVFDLDGTLVDSLPLVLAAITYAIEPYGGRPTMDIFAKLGGPPERFMATLVDDPKNVPVAVARMEIFHRENFHLIRPYAGATPMLERLRQCGVRIAIWTGRDRASTVTLLRDHQLDGFFATVVCGDDLPSHKPDPAGLREIMRRLELKPEEMLFVGDADVDVLGGDACGVNTLLIRHTRTIEPGISARAWRTVASAPDAYEIVLNCLTAPA